MNSLKIPLLSHLFSSQISKNEETDKLVSYYENAGPDYGEWSKNFNMHFGYYERRMNPFNLESMLERMNEKVLDSLKIDSSSHGVIVDMGCGVSASLRHATAKFPKLSGIGVTIVPWQKQKADELNSCENQHSQIVIKVEDYTFTSLEDNSVDYVIAIESSCYASGSSKSDLLMEIHRILKSGGRFVIGDGFLKTKKQMNPFLGQVYHQLCSSWALKELGNISDMEMALKDLRFESIDIQDISWRVAPSVAHVPHKVIGFLMKELLKKTKLNKERRDNLISPLLTMILGLYRKFFGYFLLSGTKQLT
jgi:MPBQ/MSBQ methyltransferase